MTELPRRSDRPHDRLTQLCAEMTDLLDAKGAAVADVKAVIMLDDGERGGIVLHGYDDDTDAMVDLFVHLKAIFEANGKQLLIAPLGVG
jgi:hypothetical protein